MGRRLHGFDERRAGDLATETAEFLCRDDDDFVAAMHGDVLGTLVAHPADELTEARLGILQRPMSRLGRARPSCGFRAAWACARFCGSSHADQNSVFPREFATL